jgi:hypothetical protein
MTTPITEIDKKGMSKTVTLPIKSKDNNQMTLYELSRWCALVDAVTIIDKKMATISGEVSNWVKPIAIQKYIDDKYQDILHEMIERDKMLD